MIKNIKLIFGLGVVLIAILGFISVANAATPILSLTNNNDGDTVQLYVNGDPNVSVIFYYIKTGVGLQMASLGTTNSTGFFSSNISTSSYAISPNSSVYVTLNGISGQQSNTVLWPISNSTTTGNTISLSQTGVVLNVGGSTNISVNNNSANLYLSNNSNPSVANLNLSSSYITINANVAGSTIATVCVVGSSANCASIYITVQSSGTTALTFSVNNLTIANGNNAAVTISGGTGTYYVLSNSNSSAIGTSINASVITLTANATSGSASITVCSTNMSSCGIITATAGTTNASYITFSNSTPTIPTGQNTTITISGTNGGTYYVSNNTNSGIVQTNISASTLTLYGITNGSSVITVCSSLGSCGTITATVSYSSNSGNISLSQTSLSLLTGQSISITVSGGSTPYNLPIASNNVFQASLNNNILTVYGLATGSSTVSVCSAGGGCTSLLVNVGTTSSSSSVPYFSQSSISLIVGTNTIISIYGSGNFFMNSNSNSNIASVQVNGSTALIYGLTVGTSNVSICQGSSSYCATLTVNVTSNLPPAQISAPPVETYFKLNRYLGPGDKGSDVLELQNVLKNLGFLSADPTGHYGPATILAIKKLQKKYAIKQTGNIGVSTKAKLENLKISVSGVDVSGTDQMSKLQATIDSLKAKIQGLNQ
jgi:hypothetical protein